METMFGVVATLVSKLLARSIFDRPKTGKAADEMLQGSVAYWIWGSPHDHLSCTDRRIVSFDVSILLTELLE